MSRVVLALATGALVSSFVFPALAAETATNHLGIPLAPNGGTAGIRQWGGIDDNFAVNPDGNEAPMRTSHKSSSPLASSQDEADSNDPGDPDSDHDGEVLPI